MSRTKAVRLLRWPFDREILVRGARDVTLWPLLGPTTKPDFSFFASLFALSSVVFAQDGASGDGNCDPCDESCEIFSKRDLSNVPRMLAWNDSSPFEPGEGVRWREPAPPGTVVSGRFAKRAPMYMLEFDCAQGSVRGETQWLVTGAVKNGK